jgi:septal ring factor EnvC (AmiA/AmiB activator)
LLGILLAALAVLFMQVRRLPVEQQQQEARLQARLEQLSRELATFQQGSIRMGEEITALRQQVKRLEDKQLKLEQHDPQSLPYNQAARLVGMGASIEDLTQSCGLSKAEAELFVKLHASR